MMAISSIAAAAVMLATLSVVMDALKCTIHGVYQKAQAGKAWKLTKILGTALNVGVKPTKVARIQHKTAVALRPSERGPTELRRPFLEQATRDSRVPREKAVLETKTTTLRQIHLMKTLRTKWLQPRIAFFYPVVEVVEGGDGEGAVAEVAEVAEEGDKVVEKEILLCAVIQQT
jgi:hypothetical protein